MSQLETIWKFLDAIGLVDLAKRLIATSSPAKHGRRAAQILALMPLVWAEVRRRVEAAPDDFKDDEDYQIEVGSVLGVMIYDRKLPGLTLNDTRVSWAWVETQLAIEREAWRVS